MFRVFNPEGQLVFENPNDLSDINGVIAEARLVGCYVESCRPAGTSCDGWTVNIHGPSGALIMMLPWRFACQQTNAEPAAPDLDRPTAHPSREDMQSWAELARQRRG